MTPRPRSRPRPSRRLRVGLALVLGLVLVACGQQASEPAAVSITSASAPSNTSFRLVFSQPVGAGADEAGSYLVRDPNGTVLNVVGVRPIPDDPTVVFLSTEPQSPVPYTIEARGVTLASGARTIPSITTASPVRGSTTPSPYLAGAVALDATTLLLTFDDPGADGEVAMGDDALDPQRYGLAGPPLEVHEARFAGDGEDRAQVLLTTSEMEAAEYVLSVGAGTSASDGRPIDPFRAEARFTGQVEKPKIR